MLDTVADTYDRIIALLEAGGAEFRLLEHAPERRTDLASQLRGNALCRAAKAMVVVVQRPDGARRHVLAVVPGDRRVDFGAVARMEGGGKAKLAAAEEASRLTGCAIGAVPPFSFHSGLSLLVDARLVAEPEIVFNAGRLDRSVFLRSDYYRELAKPRVAEIAA